VTLEPHATTGFVFVVSLDEPGARLPEHQALVTRGHLSGFLEGHLHDRDELARDLAVAPSTHTDVDLLLAAYERWSSAAFARLRGSFSCGLVDRASDTAYLLRDPLGHSPLFYATRGNRLFAATSQRPLLDVPGMPRDLNRAMIADHLCHRWIRPEETYFAAVRRLRPSLHLKIRRGAIEQVRHWKPEPLDWTRRDPEELLAEFDRVLDRAVARLMRPSGGNGVFLSGGLDSISVAAFAADQTRRQQAPPLEALSIAFPDPRCDERDIQRTVARSLGLPIDLLDFYSALPAGRGLLESALEMNRGFDGPRLNGWSPVYLTLARRAASRGVRVILTGGGGDEWLTVTPFYAADLIKGGHVIRLARFIRTWQRSSTKPAARLAHGMLWRFGARPLIGSAFGRIAPGVWNRNRLHRSLASDPSWMSQDPALRRDQAARAADALCVANPPGGFYVRELGTGQHQLALQEAEEQHEFGRMAGVSLRHPYWDPDLISLLHRTAPEDLDRGGRTKGLVRGTLARRFPQLGFERQRKVYSGEFFHQIMAQEGPALADRIGSFKALESIGVIQAKPAWDFARQAFVTNWRLAYRAWDLLNFEAWTRDHL
jgi:asparagine synthase (glutamine-hydrolysing)